MPLTKTVKLVLLIGASILGITAIVLMCVLIKPKQKPSTPPNNCNPCETLSGGVCKTTCTAGQTCVGTTCADKTCGACETLSGGVCKTTCTAGQTCVGTTCTDKTCGACETLSGGVCTTTCTAGQTCVGGTCTPPSKISNLSTWFTEPVFNTIFPFAQASYIFAHDGEPFWRHKDFLSAVNFMNNHPNVAYHGFGTSSNDPQTNMYEVAAFMGGVQQETGDNALSTNTSCAGSEVSVCSGFKSNCVTQGDCFGPCGFVCNDYGTWKGCGCADDADPTWNNQVNAMVCPGFEPDVPPPILNGGLTFLYEGGLSSVTLSNAACASGLTMPLSKEASELLRCKNVCASWNPEKNGLPVVSQPAFGLPNGAVADYAMVSTDGTLYKPGGVSLATTNKNAPWNQVVASTGDTTKETCRDGFVGCQYGGRGAQQLSYNFNYNDCSLALFGDYRLSKWPNLLTSTNREHPGDAPYLCTAANQHVCDDMFGFPGGSLPADILATTPTARELAWLTSLWFWMDPERSGYAFSCHDAMLEPKLGFTCTTMIINGQSSCQEGTWAAAKQVYFKQICKYLGLPEPVVHCEDPAIGSKFCTK